MAKPNNYKIMSLSILFLMPYLIVQYGNNSIICFSFVLKLLTVRMMIVSLCLLIQLLHISEKQSRLLYDI